MAISTTYCNVSGTKQDQFFFFSSDEKASIATKREKSCEPTPIAVLPATLNAHIGHVPFRIYYESIFRRNLVFFSVLVHICSGSLDHIIKFDPFRVLGHQFCSWREGYYVTVQVRGQCPVRRYKFQMRSMDGLGIVVGFGLSWYWNPVEFCEFARCSKFLDQGCHFSIVFVTSFGGAVQPRKKLQPNSLPQSSSIDFVGSEPGKTDTDPYPCQE